MRIEDYFQRLRDSVESCPAAQAFEVAYDKRSTYEGFIRGAVYFLDGSTLHLREFVDAEISPQRLMYVYQYMDAAEGLVFRYDNTGHHKDLNLSSYPDHKHEGGQKTVVASQAPELREVLAEIELLIEPPAAP